MLQQDTCRLGLLFVLELFSDYSIFLSTQLQYDLIYLHLHNIHICAVINNTIIKGFYQEP